MWNSCLSQRELNPYVSDSFAQWSWVRSNWCPRSLLGIFISLLKFFFKPENHIFQIKLLLQIRNTLGLLETLLWGGLRLRQNTTPVVSYATRSTWPFSERWEKQRGGGMNRLWTVQGVWDPPCFSISRSNWWSPTTYNIKFNLWCTSGARWF